MLRQQLSAVQGRVVSLVPVCEGCRWCLKTSEVILLRGGDAAPAAVCGSGTCCLPGARLRGMSLVPEN